MWIYLAYAAGAAVFLNLVLVILLTVRSRHDGSDEPY
jgi:hypothetical protein